MSSSTPVLPTNRQKGDHPIFSRVCHSPWASIGQKSLVFLRGFVALYQFIAIFLVLDFELKYLQRDWIVVFEFPNIVLLVQVIYTLIAFTWTYTHLYYPDYRYEDDNTLYSCARRFLSPPKQNSATNNRASFSIFYIAAHTYPLVVAFIYWAILGPQGKSTFPADEITSYSRYTVFYIFHKYAISAALAIFEIFILSSVNKPYPIWAHVNALIIISLAYIGWVYLGYFLVDQIAYYFLDFEVVGWEYTVTSLILFLAIAQAFFAFVYVLTSLRESLVKKLHDKSSK